jgi:hypothetical protein
MTGSGIIRPRGGLTADYAVANPPFLRAKPLSSAGVQSSINFPVGAKLCQILGLGVSGTFAPVASKRTNHWYARKSMLK